MYPWHQRVQEISREVEFNGLGNLIIYNYFYLEIKSKVKEVMIKKQTRYIHKIKWFRNKQFYTKKWLASNPPSILNVNTTQCKGKSTGNYQSQARPFIIIHCCFFWLHSQQLSTANPGELVASVQLAICPTQKDTNCEPRWAVKRDSWV